MKKKTPAPTLAEDALLWAASAASAISGMPPPAGLVEGVATRQAARKAAATKAGATKRTPGRAKTGDRRVSTPTRKSAPRSGPAARRISP